MQKVEAEICQRSNPYIQGMVDNKVEILQWMIGIKISYLYTQDFKVCEMPRKQLNKTAHAYSSFGSTTLKLCHLDSTWS